MTNFPLREMVGPQATIFGQGIVATPSWARGGIIPCDWRRGLQNETPPWSEGLRHRWQCFEMHIWTAGVLQILNTAQEKKSSPKLLEGLLILQHCNKVYQWYFKKKSFLSRQDVRFWTRSRSPASGLAPYKSPTDPGVWFGVTLILDAEVCWRFF